MIEPTDEMRSALRWTPADAEYSLADDCVDHRLRLLLAVVERDRLANPAAIRRALDEAVNAAEPIAGGPLLPVLRLLKRTLDHFPAKATP